MAARREAVLLLGSNQGRRVRRIREAVDTLSRETELLDVSSMYSSEPFGRSNQPWFLNLAVRAATWNTPWELLLLAKRIELEAGRRVGPRWGPRTLDIDILLLEDSEVNLPGLVIPHASIAERRFFLLPAAEVAADAVVPGYGRTVKQLLESCQDFLEVIKL
jgi:2-amino-4-hydroxy-6-hydroxymethyldihydropteridine diphosphokinase